jgi:zinc transporter 1/2/3
MLTPAVEKLSSECLPASWTESYGPWAFLFVVASILGMQLIDYVVEGAYKAAMARRDAADSTPPGAILSVHASRHVLAPPPGGGGDEETGGATAGEQCAVHGGGCKSLLPHSPGGSPAAGSAAPAPAVDRSLVVGVYLMEAGIALHSVLIGVSLGVASGSAFVTLLIALSFHQAFEGFAIGSAAVDAGLPHRRALALGALYAVATPVGIAVGIGARLSYRANAAAALLTEGVLDSVSAGILIYVGLVELVNPLMTQSVWLRAQRWYMQVLSFLFLYAGAGAMAVIGKWA